MVNSDKNDTVGWLLAGEPWVEYRTRLDLLDEPSSSECVIRSRKAMVDAPAIQKLMNAFQNWETEIVNGHKKADLLIHYLTFLGDIGLTVEDPGMEQAVRAALSHLSPEGLPQVGCNVPAHFGGTGKDAWGWALCDTPVILQALLSSGLSKRPDLMPAGLLASGIHHLMAMGRENGWPCVVSPELGKFRGPGRKDDPCPDATFLMLKVLLQWKAQWKEADPQDADAISNGIRNASGCLLDLWTDSLVKHPYMFYMGTDFRKIKAPFIWYDILHVTDVLSRCPGLDGDPRLLEMAGHVLRQADPDGRLTPQSVWKAWSDWDFGQKKFPSRWLTFLVLRLAKRLKIA